MNTSEISQGSVVRVWHHPRGHDYVVVGQNISDNKLFLIKRNCINDDGSIHRNTKSFHRTMQYSSITGTNVVSNVTRVIGHCSVDTNKIKDFIDHQYDGRMGPVGVLPSARKFVCSPCTDNTVSIQYN